MKKYDKYDESYLLEALEDSGLDDVLIIDADLIRDKMIKNFVDFSLNTISVFIRYFELIRNRAVVHKNEYCIEVLKHNQQDGKFYIFAEESKSCLLLKNWDAVIAILENIPYMNVYILDEHFSYVIAVTQEDNMVYSGIELVYPHQ